MHKDCFWPGRCPRPWPPSPLWREILPPHSTFPHSPSVHSASRCPVQFFLNMIPGNRDRLDGLFPVGRLWFSSFSWSLAIDYTVIGSMKRAILSPGSCLSCCYCYCYYCWVQDVILSASLCIHIAFQARRQGGGVRWVCMHPPNK